jgi:hypothetical protein
MSMNDSFRKGADISFEDLWILRLLFFLITMIFEVKVLRLITKKTFDIHLDLERATIKDHNGLQNQPDR